VNEKKLALAQVNMRCAGIMRRHDADQRKMRSVRPTVLDAPLLRWNMMGRYARFHWEAEGFSFVNSTETRNVSQGGEGVVIVFQVDGGKECPPRRGGRSID
jgi:hypothetical protein